MQKWEYYSFSAQSLRNITRIDNKGMVSIEEKLADVGTQGWELVSITPTSNDFVLYFKRPKS
jgi:hypothetical protein